MIFAWWGGGGRPTQWQLMPGAATDLTAFTSSSPLTWSSILTTIDSSTSSGVAPG